MSTRQIAHWAIRKNADEAPEDPWFVEHRASDHDWHFDIDHEYGSFPSHEEAVLALIEWSRAECGKDAA